MPPKPPLERMATTSPLRISEATVATISSASARSRARRPLCWISAARAGNSRRSFSGTASERKTPATTTSSACARLRARSLCRTLRRSVFERGSRIAHNRAPGVAGAQGLQRPGNRGGMMREVVDDGDAVHFGPHFEAALHALECFQRSGDCSLRNAAARRPEQRRRLRSTRCILRRGRTRSQPTACPSRRTVHEVRLGSKRRFVTCQFARGPAP